MARPRIGTTVEPRERWNLLDRDVLAWYSALPAKGPFLRSVQEMRRIIEPEAAALAALKRSDAQMEAISSACVDMGAASSMRARVDADVRFHLGILAAAGNEFLIPFGYLIASALAALFEYTTRGRADLAHAHQLHERIEEAIRRKQPQSARDAVRRLVNNSVDFLGRKSHERTRKQAGLATKQVESLVTVAEVVRARVAEGRELELENKRAALNLAQARQRLLLRIDALCRLEQVRRGIQVARRARGVDVVRFDHREYPAPWWVRYAAARKLDRGVREAANSLAVARAARRAASTPPGGRVLRPVGRQATGRKLLKDLLAYACRLAKAPAKIDYFATSLPTMLLASFEFVVTNTENAGYELQ